MTYTTSLKLGNAHQEILNVLDFYSSDITFLEKLLTEVLKKNNHYEVKNESEHFQNQFIIQQKNIDDLRSKILINKHEAALEAKVHAGKVDERLVTDINQLKREEKQIEKTIEEIRTTFKLFVAKWL
jgi:Glu-tRNA(Gln) amidotransferase subunit E-like FAD-binding protein